MPYANASGLWKRTFNLLLFLIFLTWASPCLADGFLDHVTWGAPRPPGSMKVEYGGFVGLLLDELNNRAQDVWEDDIRLRYSYNPLAERDAFKQMGWAFADIDTGGRWWERHWTWSLPQEKGGAPVAFHTFYVGRSDDFFRAGPFYITNKFKFKMRHYEVELTDPIAVRKWKVKIKPSLKLGFRPFPTVRKMRLAVRFIYSRGFRKLFYLEVFGAFRTPSNLMAGIELSFLRW